MQTLTGPATTTYSAGIDLHKKPVQVHVINADGTTVYHGTIRKNKRAALRALLARFGTNITVGLESTYNWYWVADELAGLGIPCLLGHATDVHAQMPGKHKTDPLDAEKISRMVWTGTLPPAYCYPARWRATRDLLRKRLRLVWEHTRHLLHAEGVADQYLLAESSLTAAGYSAAFEADVEQLLDTDQYLQVVLAGVIKKLEATILQRAQVHDQQLFDLFERIPGIGPVIALTLLYEIHDIARFRTPQQFASYARVVNARCESAGKRVGRGKNKRGNPYLCRVLHTLALTSVRYMPPLAEWYRATIARHGRRTARRILAHKWAVAIHAIWRRREAFDLGKFLGTAYQPRAQHSH